MKRSTHPLLQLLVMLAMALGMLLIATTVTAVAVFLSGGTMSTSVLLWSQALTQLLSFLAPVLLMTLIYYRGRQREFLRLDFGGRQWGRALTGVAVLLLMVPLIEWLTEWNDGWDLGRLGTYLRSLQDQTEGILEQLMGVTSVGGLLANLLVVAVVPAVCEELFFRAGIQNLLERWFGGRDAEASGRMPVATHAAVWVTALIFSLAHGEVFAFMPRLLMGVVLGYLYVGSGSLLPNMLAHCVNNAIVVVLYWLVARGVLDIDPELPIDFGTLLTVCCTLASVLLFYATFVLAPKRR